MLNEARAYAQAQTKAKSFTRPPIFRGLGLASERTSQQVSESKTYHVKSSKKKHIKRNAKKAAGGTQAWEGAERNENAERGNLDNASLGKTFKMSAPYKNK